MLVKIDVGRNGRLAGCHAVKFDYCTTSNHSLILAIPVIITVFLSVELIIKRLVLFVFTRGRYNPSSVRKLSGDRI